MAMTILTEAFKTALKFVLKQEGGYVNNPHDLGGETYQGISRKYHPSWIGWQIIDDCKEESSVEIELSRELTKNIILQGMVSTFYKENYWDTLSLDNVMHEFVAIKLFDMGVNLGVPRVANILQNCLNSFILPGQGQPELVVDNVVGKKTISALNEIIGTVTDGSKLIINILTIQHGYIYIKLAQNNPEQRVFIKGWIMSLQMNVVF